MDIKCKCQHCNEPLLFDSERAGEQIVCPHCGMETALFIPTIPLETPIQPPVAEDVPPRVIVDMDLREAKPKLIETALDEIGATYFAFGLFGAFVFAFVFVIALAQQQPWTVIVSILGAVAVVITQGYIIKIIFNAMAEIIRLLRNISNRKNDDKN